MGNGHMNETAGSVLKGVNSLNVLEEIEKVAQYRAQAVEEFAERKPAKEAE